MDQQDVTTPRPERRSAGTIDGLRRPLSWPSDRPFRILSIDGGGIKGIFPATVLTAFERELCDGRSSGDYFDLITGTSTGGIIALGLSAGLPAKEILRLYIDRGAEIFPPKVGILKWWRTLRSLSKYSYEREPLERALRTVFGDMLLGDARRRLCIPSFEGTYGEVVVFKTPHHPDFRIDWQQSMVSVALATAAAPTFFKTYRSGADVFADGGVWANNPVMIGLVDALSTHDVGRRQVEVLSISCGDLDVPFTRGQNAAGGIWHWKKIINSAMHLQSLNATGQAGLLIGRDRLIRIEPDEQSARLNMDDFLGAVAQLPAAADRAAIARLDDVRRFFLQPAIDAPAFYGPRSSHAPAINFA